MSENKNERFKRLASARTNEVIKRLNVLANCSNKSAYSYTSEDIEKIFSVIESETKKAKAQFKTSKKKDNLFKL